METIYISSDHGGFELKQKILDWLPEFMEYVKVVDLGPYELDPDDDYPEFAFPLAERVAAELEVPGAMGILICRSGNGMTIAANKVEKIRAALCFTPDHAVKAVEHNHANILVLDSDYGEDGVYFDILRAFCAAHPEEGGRHQRRVKQITDYEQG